MSNKEGKSALSRRAFVGRLAAGAAMACAAGAAGIGRAKAVSTRGESTTHSGVEDGRLGTAPAPESEVQATSWAPSAPPPWELVRPLALGSVVAHGWRLTGLTAVIDGSFVLTLQNERGRAHRVHVCRNDGRPQGLVYTKRFDLVVMNGGRGDLPTEEGLAQAVAETAHVLAANEGDRRHLPVVTALLPQAERVRLFAGAARLR